MSDLISSTTEDFTSKQSIDDINAFFAARPASEIKAATLAIAKSKEQIQGNIKFQERAAPEICAWLTSKYI